MTGQTRGTQDKKTCWCTINPLVGVDSVEDIWLCERKRDKSGKTIFIPIDRDYSIKAKIPSVVVVEKGDPDDLNEAMEKLNQEGFELLDIDNRHNDFFSSLTAMMVNKEGGGKSGFIKFRKTESAISRAIH